MSWSSTGRSGPDQLSGAFRSAIVVALATMAVAAFGVAARSTYGAQTSSDEPQYLLTALSLAQDFDLNISDEIDRRAFEPFHEIDLSTQTTPLNGSGQRLSPHGPLLPLIVAPAMWVGGWVGVRITLVLIGGLVAGLTAWTAISRFNVGATSSMIGVGSLMVGSPIAAYSTQVFPEILAALCIAGIAAALFAPCLATHHLAVIALAVIALPWLSVKYVPVAAVVVVGVIWRLRRTYRWLGLSVFVGALGVAGVVYLIVHRQIYGGWTVYATGDHFINAGEFAVVGTNPDYIGRTRRLAGLIVDRRFGVAPWAPSWLLVPAALAAFLARPRRSVVDMDVNVSDRADHRWLVALPLVAGWLTATYVALTMHGWWSPGRQIVVIMPLGALALATWIDGRRALRIVVAVAGAIGASNWIWLGIEASTGRRTLIFDFYETAAAGYRLLAPIFVPGAPVNDTSDLVLAGWSFILVATAALAWRVERAPEDSLCRLRARL